MVIIFQSRVNYEFVYHIGDYRWKLSPLEISSRLTTDKDKTIYSLKITANTCLAATLRQSEVKKSDGVFQSTKKGEKKKKSIQ